MKFLCDVHISFKLVATVKKLGFDCIHINSILEGYYTKDEQISEFVDQNDYTLITKDADFRNSFFIKNTPKKLFKINLGNISNTELILIFEQNLSKIEHLTIDTTSFIVEIDSNNITFLAI